MRFISEQTAGRTTDARSTWFSRTVTLTKVLVGILFSNAVQEADSATLTWDRADSHTNLAAFVLKYGTTSGSYTGQVSVATNLTSAMVNNLTPGVAYFFVVTAIDVTNQESDPSNQISYSVPVAGTNLPPTLNPISDVTTRGDAGWQTITLTGVTDGETTETQTVTVTTVSSNPSLIPAPEVDYASPNTTGTLIFAPVPKAFGTATITVTANDGGASNNIVTRSFMVTVKRVRKSPTLNALSNLGIDRNAGLQLVDLSGITSGEDNELQTLTVTAVSSSPSLIPNPVITYTSPDSDGTLEFTPATNAVGSAIITVTASDDAASSNIVTRTFAVMVGSALSTGPTLRIRISAANEVILTVTGEPEQMHEIQVSRDFTNWIAMSTVTLGVSGEAEVADSITESVPNRFYRSLDPQP